MAQHTKPQQQPPAPVADPYPPYRRLYAWLFQAWLVMFLTPFALNLVAAILQKYPYAACGRLTQHLAPAICLITASGVVHAIEWRYKLASSQRLVVGIVVGFYAAIGLGAMGLALAGGSR